jgi:hypothetical protein
LINRTKRSAQFPDKFLLEYETKRPVRVGELPTIRRLLRFARQSLPYVYAVAAVVAMVVILGWIMLAIHNPGPLLRQLDPEQHQREMQRRSIDEID